VNKNPDSFLQSWPGQRVLYIILVLAFFLLTAVVYTDHPLPGGQSPLRLSPAAQQGQEIWRKHNCQTCHQIYGFGGFLGPDLTNVVSRLPASRFGELLKDGSGRMPAFGFNDEQVSALVAYLTDLDRSGQGTPIANKRPPSDLGTLVQDYASQHGDVPEQVLAGSSLFLQYQCRTCHQAFKKGLLESPDLTLAFSKNGRQEIEKVLKNGRKMMPPFGLEGQPARDMIAFLEWIDAHRDDLIGAAKETEGLVWRKIPWFTYDQTGE